MAKVAVIIGSKRNSVFQVLSKNNSCHTCSVSPDKEHNCYKYHTDSSCSMESKALVEGFGKAPTIYMYGPYYWGPGMEVKYTT